MNLDMLSRGLDILQRVGGAEQINQFMTIVYGVICVFGLLNCILGYRILRFWMMIFGFLIGAGAGFGVTYLSGVQNRMTIIGAMAGLGIVLAIVSFLIYRAGIFVLGFGIGISLSIYLVHPTSSFSFFLCLLVGVGLGILAMRYAKGVIIVGTSVLGGVLAGFSLAQIGGLAQFPYGAGLAAGIALLGMLIQFAINKDRYEDDDEDDEYEDEPEEKPVSRRNKRNAASDQKSYNDRDRNNGRNVSSDRRGGRSDRYGDGRRDNSRDDDSRLRSRRSDLDDISDRRNSRIREDADRNGRYTDRKNSSESSRRREVSGKNSSNNSGRSNYSDSRKRNSSASDRTSDRNRSRSSGSSDGRRRNQSRSSDNGYPGRRNTGSSGRSRYEDATNANTYEDFEKDQQRKRQLDIENMADFDMTDDEAGYNHEKPLKDLDLDPDDYDEWEDD